jgi:hypothetical protein
MVSALRWLRDQVVDCTNRGLLDVEIIAELSYPVGLFDHPYMAEVYGARDYIVRDLFREENGWWASRNPTDLHPGHPDDVAAAVLDAVDPNRVIAHARTLAEAGDLAVALAVIDLVALAPGRRPLRGRGPQPQGRLVRSPRRAHRRLRVPLPLQLLGPTPPPGSPLVRTHPHPRNRP